MKKQLEIVVENYDSDKDIKETGGARGIAQADSIYRKTHGHPEIVSKHVKVMNQIDELENLGRIASRKDRGVKGIKIILRELKNEGYEVKPYSQMRKEEALDYLNKIRDDISDELYELYYQEELFNHS